MEQLWIDTVDETPLGTIWVAASVKGLVAVRIGGVLEAFRLELENRFGVLATPRKFEPDDIPAQIWEYLQGQRKVFQFPIHWDVMSAFQQKALRAVYQIPYGEKRSYGEIAAQIGVPGAARAVGRANATNPMPLVIPCHRVVAANGSLHGYSGGEGLPTKAWLLAMETAQV